MHFPLFRPLAPLAVRISARFPPGAACARLGFSTNAPAQHSPGSAQKHEPQQHLEEPKGLYNMPQDHSHHGDPRKFINPDGTYTYPITSHLFHFEDTYSPVPKQQIVSINGKKMIKGIESRSLVELFSIHQLNIPFFPRKRMNVYGNHDLLMKAEFLFFWTPTFIIWSLTIPVFTMLYMVDEAVYTAMTVKVIGRQWYWIYEVESPVD
ncbi:hypothetical protein, conserved [Eimeria tenella]|uniref:Cytochrome oxidase subunit II copper A binding domain-containing protein n=1 Tax=Eimeria tenella TaxID=5802 RepID=H9B9F9_EIMTE|nr:hypothetical protein, conserved [Eimeria tenella]AET50619.1 hypothetical protein [Eimeria tenella]CDJ44006.1 hypothetical protein, conserved [Eimeria tenella]|eukprot:XP_013234755.1 hypothetical protein, conserved [Eimeria tenella]